MLTNDNNVRRNDLSLRLKYIGIKTRIFKIAPFKYVIYVPIYQTILKK